MAEKLIPRVIPMTADDFQPAWLHSVRAAVVRNNHELRAGFPLSIEVRGPDRFQPLNLPNNSIELKSAEDRDKVLGWLNGTIELPPLPPPETTAP